MSRCGSPSLGKLQMPKDKTAATQRKAVRFSIKRLGTAACAIAAVCYGLVYFRNDLPTWNVSSDPQSAGRGVPYASIIIPYNPNKGLCRLHALDNATGKIEDGGLVDCKDASTQNSVAWKSLVDQERASEIRKSFRHQ
jgi:hypothetical protein